VIQEDIPMLVITRKLGQRFVIADSITVTVLQMDRSKIKLGIEAPPDIKILREELQTDTWGWRSGPKVLSKGH
jgi:carbon storage regulator